MLFAPFLTLLATCAQFAPVLGDVLQITPRNTWHALAKRQGSILQVTPRNHVDGPFARALLKRQGTCPAGTSLCPGQTGCCPTGSTCTSDGHCNVACTAADPPCADGCCDAAIGAVCKSGQCVAGGSTPTPTPSPASGSCPSGTSLCPGQTGCCPTGSTCTTDGHCNVACTAADPPCADGCCDAAVGAVCQSGQCVVGPAGGGSSVATPAAPATAATTNTAAVPGITAPTFTATAKGATTTAAAAGSTATPAIFSTANKFHVPLVEGLMSILTAAFAFVLA